MIRSAKPQSLIAAGLLAVTLSLGGCNIVAQNGEEPAEPHRCVLTKGDIEIYLGMPVTELSEALDTLIEDNYVTILSKHSLTITCADGGLRLFSADDKDWTLNGYAFAGLNIKAVKDKLGDKFDEQALDVNSRLVTLNYYYDINGTPVDKETSYDYFIQMHYFNPDSKPDAGAVVSILASQDFSTDSIAGTVYIQESGSKSASLPAPRIDGGFAVVDLTHDGEGDFVISQSGTELFRRPGAYSGRVHLPTVEKGELEISSDGDWTITARYYYDYKEKDADILNGTGDYITGYYAPARNFPLKWNVVYKGEGRFVINQFYWDNGKQYMTAVDTTGPYSSEMECVFDDYFPVSLEILADGDWTIELLTR